MTTPLTLAQTRELVAASLMEQIAALSEIKQKCFRFMMDPATQEEDVSAPKETVVVAENNFFSPWFQNSI